MDEDYREELPVHWYLPPPSEYVILASYKEFYWVLYPMKQEFPMRLVSDEYEVIHE